MFLLIYSFNYQDYMDRCDENPWIQEGDNRFVFKSSIEECIEELNKDIESYGDDEIYENELNISEGNEPYNGSHLVVHGLFEIKEQLDFDIKDTKEYKEFLIKKKIEIEFLKENKKKEKEKQELAELKRLKDKYEN